MWAGVGWGVKMCYGLKSVQLLLSDSHYISVFLSEDSCDDNDKYLVTEHFASRNKKIKHDKRLIWNSFEDFEKEFSDS